MKHILESNRKSPKFICRIFRNKKIVFYKTFLFTEKNKEVQRLKAQVAVRNFLLSNNEIRFLKEGTRKKPFCTDARKAITVYGMGVYFKPGGFKNYPEYVGCIGIENNRFSIGYSTNYFGEALALKMAKRTANMYRVFFGIPHIQHTDTHIKMLCDYIDYKKKNGKCRNPTAKKAAVKKIIKRFTKLERYCKLALSEYEDITN